MTDFSFISLHRSMDDVNKALDNRETATIFAHANVVLGKSVTCQITNVAGGIALDEYFEVWVADTCGNNLYDITPKVAITQFVHDTNGTTQIAFEILPLGMNSGGNHYILKFIGQAETFYSTPVLLGGYGVSYDVAYWSTRTFEDISYFNSQIKQQITLRGLDRSGKESASVVSSYDQVFNGGSLRRINPKVNRLWLRNYVVQYLPEFIFDRLQVLFNHEFIYLNGERITNKPQLEATEFIGETNWGQTSFQTAYDPNDRFDYSLQVFEELQITDKKPFGSYTVATFVEEVLSVEFNQQVTPLSGEITITKDGEVFQTIPVGSLVFSSQGFTHALDTEAYTTGTYTVSLPEGLVQWFFGISEATEWTFIINNGNYSKDHYSSGNYLTN